MMIKLLKSKPKKSLESTKKEITHHVQVTVNKIKR